MVSVIPLPITTLSPRTSCPTGSIVEAIKLLTRFTFRIGEKMIAWSDEREAPSVETILGNVSLYWFTGCYPSSIWPYREVSDT